MGTIMYKQEKYFFNFNHDFNDFMNTEIFRILIKDIREAKKKENLSITIERDIEPQYLFGKLYSHICRDETLTINNNEVRYIPSYAIQGLMYYVDKYVGWD